jgi:hypothetical protein
VTIQVVVDGRTVESAKEILPLYYLLIDKRGTQGYIRILVHVPSLVLRPQSYIVYLCLRFVLLSLCLIICNSTTLTGRPILRYISIPRSSWQSSW